MTHADFPYTVHSEGLGVSPTRRRPCAGFTNAGSAHSYALWVSSKPQYLNFSICVEGPEGRLGEYLNGFPHAVWHNTPGVHFPAGPRGQKGP